VTVHFIGAGPGAADLITVRGLRLIERSPVCLYAGSLVPPELLEACPPGARLVDTADLNLDQIVKELVSAHEAGLDVARLCSGDPSVFSAVAEQLRRLDDAGVPYDITPGVPTVAQTVILTRTSARATPMPPGEDLASLSRSRSTMVLHLAVQRIDAVVAELVPGYGEDCPVAVVARASREDEVILRGTLADIAAQVHEAGVKRTAVIVVGAALTAENFRDSHLYSADRCRTS
jgi:precorrin-4/cobalt-precorrin-4 C11-methyltransferase